MSLNWIKTTDLKAIINKNICGAKKVNGNEWNPQFLSIATCMCNIIKNATKYT